MSSRTDVNPPTKVTARLISEGEIARGVRSVQIVLSIRGITISDEERERIIACTDPDQIERWLQRAASIDTVDQLFNWSGHDRNIDVRASPGHHEYKTEILAYGQEKRFIHGVAEGVIMSMRLLLEARGITLSDELLFRARCCTDLNQLERWVKCVGAIDSADQLFEWPHLQTSVQIIAYNAFRPTALQYFVEGHTRGAVKAIQLILAARNIPVSDEMYERMESSASRHHIHELEEWLKNAATIDSADQLFQESMERRVRTFSWAVLQVMGEKGIAVSDEIRERITSCTDLDLLTQWMRRISTIETADQLFD
jgi:hypothetical protein